jgi:vacuolar-type H+-ATPase subunit E/Vma4
MIGGFILKYETYNLDNSFKTIIDENRYLIGKRLYSALEKTGELNG